MKTIYQEPGKYSITIQAGYYKFECWGAQGGMGSCNGDYIVHGGPGAYASGYIKVKTTTTFYCFIGGKGWNGSVTPNTQAQGGYNGGGRGGMDIGDDDGSGGGGGSTDIRAIDGDWDSINSLNSRIIVAAGGSGSAFNSYGAPGGDLTGYFKSSHGINNNIASNTTQNKGYSLGKGEDGRPFSATPSSGAGGGYYGGYAVNGIVAPTYLAVSSSGSSYVSGYNGCKANNQFIFRHPQILNGNKQFMNVSGQINQGNIGDGAIAITRLVNEVSCNFFGFKIKHIYISIILLK